MSEKNQSRYKIMKVLNFFFLVSVVIAAVTNLMTLYFSSHGIDYWNITINISVLLFMFACLLLLINRNIKNKISTDFLESYLKEQNGELIKSSIEENLIKIEDKLFNVNIRFTKNGLFVLKQRASTAAEIEAHLFNGTKKTLKTSKYNAVWQNITLNNDNEIEIVQED